jgi:hypothetical protein
MKEGIRYVPEGHPCDLVVTLTVSMIKERPSE